MASPLCAEKSAMPVLPDESVVGADPRLGAEEQQELDLGHEVLGGHPLSAKLYAVRGFSDDHADIAALTAQDFPVGDRPRQDRSRQAPRVRLGWPRRYTRWVVTLDLLGGAAAAGLCGPAGAWTSPAWIVIGLPVLLVLTITVSRGYEHRLLSRGAAEFRLVLAAGIYLLAGGGALALATGSAPVRSAVLLAVPLATALSLCGHALVRRALHELRRHGLCQRRAVAVGMERSVAELVRTTQRDPEAGLSIVGACISRVGSTDVEGVPVLGTPAEICAVLDAVSADTVVLTSWSDVSQEDLRRLAWELEGSGIRLLVAPRVSEVAVPRMHLITVDGTTLIDIEEPEFTGLRRVGKAALDYVLTVTALVLLSPVLVAVAVAVKFSSPGPVLFRQERVGRGGRTVTMHKFRSMYVDAEDRLQELAGRNEHGVGPLFKMKDDPRVTSVGRLLRRYSLDELPQLFDVLSRRMSLVGPRPPLPQEVAQYETDVHRRLLVLPGITGLWQVSGRSDLSWAESVRLDLNYVENWSLSLDVQIIVRTVRAVLRREGAY
jgi:exopolysaccharide biosynthesis polyprenyl glycosylphosphotransferase